MSDMPVTWMEVVEPAAGTATSIMVDEEPGWLGEALSIRTGERMQVQGVRRVDADRVLLTVTRDTGEYAVSHSTATALQRGDDLMLVPVE